MTRTIISKFSVYIRALNEHDLDTITALFAKRAHMNMQGRISIIESDAHKTIFENLIQTGWAYTTLDHTHVIAHNNQGAILEATFTRFNKHDHKISTMTAYYTYQKTDTWHITGITVL